MLDDRSRYPFPRIRLLSMTRHDCFPSISDLLFSPKCSHNLIDRVTGFSISLNRLSDRLYILEYRYPQSTFDHESKR